LRKLYSDADCTPAVNHRSVAASLPISLVILVEQSLQGVCVSVCMDNSF